MKWSRDRKLSELRTLIVDCLKKKGEPLRWAITDVRLPINNDSNRQFKVEAILIID